MAEIIGTTIGVVGFIGQLFDGCVKAYGYFTTASNFDADSQRLLCKVRIEEMRFVVWGREWGVVEGKLEAHLAREQNPQLRLLATQILEELYGTVTDFQKLQSKYGLSGSDGAFTAPAAGCEGDKTSTNGNGKTGKKTSNGTAKSTVAAGERSWKREFALRTKWVIQGASVLISHCCHFLTNVTT